MEINTKEPEYTRVSTYTNVSKIEYSCIDNKKPLIIGSLRYTQATSHLFILHVDAGLDIYLSVILTQNAARALEFISYQCIITSANHKSLAPV